MVLPLPRVLYPFVLSYPVISVDTKTQLPFLRLITSLHLHGSNRNRRQTVSDAHQPLLSVSIQLPQFLLSMIPSSAITGVLMSMAPGISPIYENKCFTPPNIRNHYTGIVNKLVWY